MAKSSKGVVHEGKTLFWSGDMITKCGLRYPKGNHTQEGFFARVTCGACKSAKRWPK
ncbi:hypothetical protein [Amycolatopsis sp. CA-230715]|uniref:hypothetical protein n=1 Tax=Amycolatopsis sp. CA-230715 TaxID=2745196 RepID=UPI001C01751E|nr:hypothetical protein [Amycolatopsis sp. CA-230715]QWF80449.1 hypothetical protein HUW46_03871 [Amycolatopsis sp. CA-230715]